MVPTATVGCPAGIGGLLMTNVAVSAPGTPIWVDLGSPDVEASARFYGELFGWDAEITPHPAAGLYTMFRKGGKEVAGAAPLQSEGQPPAWTTYLSTDSVDASAAKIADAGGSVLAPPFDVLEAGRMAIAEDPTGAVFGLWQAKDMKGAELFNQPGSLCWNELSTRDLDRAIGFYSEVFGFDVMDSDTPEMRYVQWRIDGKSVGGAMPTSDMVPAEVPAHWLSYFAVSDLGETLAKAKDLGGTVVFGPVDSPQGPFATVMDPQGAMFAVIQMSSQ